VKIRNSELVGCPFFSWPLLGRSSQLRLRLRFVAFLVGVLFGPFLVPLVKGPEGEDALVLLNNSQQSLYGHYSHPVYTKPNPTVQTLDFHNWRFLNPDN